MSSGKKLKIVGLNVEMAAGEAARAGEASEDFSATPTSPDPEVRTLAKRRKFNSAYKLALLSEIDIGSLSPGRSEVQLAAQPPPPELCVALQGVPAGGEREGLTCPIFLYQVECERFSEEDLARKGE